MLQLENINIAILIWMAIGILVFILNLFVTAPYGRHTKTTWGPLINNRLGWFLMEFPTLLIFPSLVFYKMSLVGINYFILFFTCIWLIHYINRTIFFPLRISKNDTLMPLSICFMGFIFNCINGAFLGLGIFQTIDLFTFTWLYDPRFLLGLSLFILGMYINWHADTLLISLRKNNNIKNNGYVIPRNWLFEYISCPNHFGEILEWLGFAILTWNLAGFSFALWTLANLIPRTLSHHKWYKKEFKNYPPNRKAVIPFIL